MTCTLLTVPWGDRPVGFRQHGHQGNDHHADQRVSLIDFRSWVFQSYEMLSNILHADPQVICHRSSSVLMELQETARRKL